MHPHIHWTPSTVNAGNVGWSLEYSEANIDDIFPLTTIDNKAFACGTTLYKHQVDEFDPIIKSDRSLSAMFKARVFRSSTGDTYNDNAFLHEFDLHYEIAMLGSRQEYVV